MNSQVETADRSVWARLLTPGHGAGGVRRGVRALGAAIALTVGVAGCRPTLPDPVVDTWRQPASTAGTSVAMEGTSVALVGDSLVAYDAGWSASPLTVGGELLVWSLPGAPYVEADGWLDDVAVDVAVIALGANSCSPIVGGDGFTSADVTALQRLVWDARRAPDVASRVVLVTVAPAPDAPQSFKDHCAVLNHHLRTLAASSPVYRLADFAAEAEGEAAWFTDFVHHTSLGADAYRATIEAAVVG